LWIELPGCAGKKTVLTNNTATRFETVFILCDVLWGTLVPLFLLRFLLYNPPPAILTQPFAKPRGNARPTCHNNGIYVV